MELNREQIIMALDCCTKAETLGDCEELGCPALTKHGCYFYLRTDDDNENAIHVELLKSALSLISELTEENERLKAENAEQDEAIIKALQRMGEVRRETQADTVHKTIAAVKIKCQRVTYPDKGGTKETFVIDAKDLEEIEKSILRGNGICSSK